MDKRYRDLFTLIAQTIANTAEQVMDLHKSNNEEKEYQTAEIMRNDYLDLRDKLKTEDSLVKADYARLLVGAVIVTNQLDNKIKNEQKALQAYKIDILPKLDQINNETDMEKALVLANELFEVKEEEKQEESNN